jgi:hypothetical protein
MTMAAIAKLASGFLMDSGSPYEEAMNQYREYAGKAEGVQNPFLQAGTGAIKPFQDWLSRLQNPMDFINNTMGQYQESPFAKYQQQQATRAAQNFGSASGLSGSTPLMLQAQENARNISSQDMNTWLQNVLGINTQYGAGQQGLINTGANAANALTTMYGDMGRSMGEAAYGREAGHQQNIGRMLGGFLRFF